MKDILVNFSSGCESTALLCWHKEQGNSVQAVHFVNSQRAVEETQRCKIICNELSIPLDVVPLGFDMGSGALMDSGAWAPLSALYACFYSIRDVQYGLHKNCVNLPRVERIHQTFDAVTDLNNNWKTKLSAPLVHLTKKEQWDLIPNDLKRTVSYCWVNRNKPCGTCGKCEEWRDEVWQT